MIKFYHKNCADLIDPMTDQKSMALVSKSRQEKIKKLKHASDRKRSYAAGLLEREILSAHGLTMDDIFYNEHGKPLVNGLYYNLSHSGDYAFGVVSNVAVGCDVERIKEPKPAVAKRFFSEKEYQSFLESENPAETFYMIWTRKESYIKMTGQGLAQDLTSFCTIELDSNTAWFFTQVFDGYVFSVCAEAPFHISSFL